MFEIRVQIGKSKRKTVAMKDVKKCRAYQAFQDGCVLNLVEYEVNGKYSHIDKAFKTLGDAHEVAVAINILSMGQPTPETHP